MSCISAGAGKDRTGVVSAVILKRLGCGDREIIDDYMETKDSLMPYLMEYIAENPDTVLETVLFHMRIIF